MTGLTSSRKLDHLHLCAETDVAFGNSGFSDVRLVHNAVPECSASDIDIRTEFLGRKLSAPIFIAAMTGGHPDTAEVNKNLAAAAEHFNIPMGVGSQRAALENPDLADSFTVVRETAPSAFLAGNISAVQLRDHGLEWADRAVEMIDADALCIHLNFLQEMVQVEGDRSAVGILDTIRAASSELSVPVIVKETGSGISREAASALFDAGANAVDVGGFGGTSWAKIEKSRASDKAHQNLGSTFLEWGIPTAVSVFEVAQVRKGPVIATGGLKNGLDAAKAIALGADMAGMALTLLPSALEGKDALFERIETIFGELKTAMFLTGATNISELAHVRYYLTGTVREMTNK
ncbi:MAG TPA: type 2 isopentenyl-diphosphate Delta-isomerase [Methanocorpusculum sp.]|nr:type 2 isopentenyl-diphosphate Delta-isomerase [Methanocorpusculum parvum]MBQ2771916.1 type 2 isopentenyl-diphosphate Delta-isomerase [Methanocorpusculum sp.]MBR4117400.1 type 2 isopentenyl-diphosphate Delta-isomerase [Methanocorpusculum sp.]HJJ63681.1 type 2 isopentenyl-diphosphate Delta-isomerase [Methanocorpusculum sp.]HJJ67067.1 type 2 isopentenyl-diphosphate Delta-isomerase [Methanocorpusculum sp.]